MARQYSKAKTITVFGSGSARLSAADLERARQLGAELAQRGFMLCNGGYGGIMAASAEGAHTAGAKTVGVTLSRPGWGEVNEWIDELVSQPDLLSRIGCLIERGDGYVILGGGTGTLAEIGVLMELLNKHLPTQKPIVFLGGFWSPLLGLLARERILRAESPFKAVEGMEMTGSVAQTQSPEAAARYLSVNLLGGQ